MAKLPLALQLYTVRDKTSKDFVGTVKTVAEIGYAGVEIAGDTGGLSAPDMKKLLDDLGLKVAGNHTGIDQIEADFNAVVDYNKTIGNGFIVVPYLGEERRQGAEGWRATATKMNELGAKLKEAGFQLCYHNHSFEFQKFDGATGMEIFYGTADAALVQAEVDVFWVQHGGENPVEFLNRYKGRTPLIHLKDMANDANRSFAEVGEGILDMGAIVATAEANGAKWFIVEQDTCPGDTIDSAKLSYKNIKEKGWA